MKILLTTDYNISASEEMRETLKAVIKDAFDRFNEHITRLEVKFRDKSSCQYRANDRNKRSVLETLLKGLQPLAVTSTETLLIAICLRDPGENVLGKDTDKMKTDFDTIKCRLRN